MDGMDARCSLCGRPRRRIAGVLACSRCDSVLTWPSFLAGQGEMIHLRIRHRLGSEVRPEDVDIEAPEERGDPR